MESKEFFNQVQDALDKTEGDDPVGVAFFISDMYELFEKWDNDPKSEIK